VSLNGTPVEAKLCIFTLESTHFIFILCPIYIDDGASAKFNTNSQITDYSAGGQVQCDLGYEMNALFMTLILA
jgi:hypothetical protein